MSTRYLLDTSAASYAITKKSPVFDRHLVRVPMAELGVSTVSEGELRYGLARRPSTPLQSMIDDCCPRTFAGIDSEKTRLIEFGRFAAQDRERRGEGKPETFTFLGFTHFCGKREQWNVHRLAENGEKTHGGQAARD